MNWGEFKDPISDHWQTILTELYNSCKTSVEIYGQSENFLNFNGKVSFFENLNLPEEWDSVLLAKLVWNVRVA